MSPVTQAVQRAITQSANSESPLMATLSTKKGKTRGRNPREIEYLAFDLEKVDTLPKSIQEFMEVTKVTEQTEVVALLINGYNDSVYSAASDEIGEFINDAWDKETQAQFRLAVRNYSKMTNMSIEDSVNLIKPGLDKAYTAKVEAAKAAAAEAAKVTA